MNERDTDKLLEAFRTLGRESRGMEAPARVEAALRAEFRRRKKMAVLLRTVAAGAIAAAALIAAWAFGAGRSPGGAGAPPAARVVIPRPEPAGGTPAPPPGVEMAAAKTAPVKARPRPVARRQAPQRPAQRELATEFLRVPGADPFEPLDPGRMVRVQLPRSALEVFGLPLNESRWGERVKADVVLAEDGMVRAVRFVQ